MKLKDVLQALGPLAPLYEDPDVTEIMVDGPEAVYVEKSGQMLAVDVAFETPAALLDVITPLMALGGIALGVEQTSGHVRLPGGDRAFAILPPTAASGYHLVIRKFSPHLLTMEMLLEFGSITPAARDFLQTAILERQNMLVVGGTGSGKTTFANILTADIPENERVIAVERTLEMRPRCPRLVRLAADSSPDHSVGDLIAAAAKMRPDRILFGEVTGPEAIPMLELLTRGHDGSLITLHADTPEDALRRLEMSCLKAKSGLGMAEIRYLIAKALQLITVQHLLADGTRKITHISELRGLKGDSYDLQSRFAFNADKNVLEAV